MDGQALVLPLEKQFAVDIMVGFKGVRDEFLDVATDQSAKKGVKDGSKGGIGDESLAFSKSTPKILENSSCLVDSGLPSTKMRNLGQVARNSDGGDSVTMEFLSSVVIIPFLILLCW